MTWVGNCCNFKYENEICNLWSSRRVIGKGKEGIAEHKKIPPVAIKELVVWSLMRLWVWERDGRSPS